MRSVFVCRECSLSYLPPESLAYSDGPASPVWCSICQRRAAALGVAEPAAARAVALLAARAAEREARPPAAARRGPDVRPSRPALTRRSGSGPGSTRTRLG
ncbi:hypothetical protein [Kitasatospora sp. NPDC085879]|jgi:hypothetical protein|uniref:hypothetical protein n=1 Tax=Kitasatospora sp. NPDC085879 TaxID=3154769 RepID=UPI00343E3A65